MTRTRMAILTVISSLVSLAGATPALAACSGDAPAVTTQKQKYAQSEAVSISGCGFGYGEMLSVLVKGPDGRFHSTTAAGQPGPFDWTADDTGRFDVAFEFPGSRGRNAGPGEHGTFTVTVLTSAGFALASSTFERTAEITATDPDFFWLPPTVPSAAPFTGPFDPTALEDLVVEVCELDAQDECVEGRPPVETFTWSALPMPSRLALDEAGEFYTVSWLTGTSGVSRDVLYRVRVFKAGIEIGSIDVDFVQNTPELASVEPGLVGVVRGQQLTLRFRVQHPTARTRVTINEVESNGGVPGDWIELYNSASVPVSLAGYIVKDNDDAHVATLPDGAEIPAKGVYIVEESALGFGLGANDAARFFTPDGAILVDSYAWATHAPTTYGRCPDGSGTFQVNATSTKGAANDCSFVIRINEVESNGGTPADWVELYNPGPAPANLKGFVLMDGDDTHAFPLPPVVVGAGAYLVLDEASWGFGLDDADAVRLLRPDGSIADAFAWAAHASTTYGRCPSGSGPFVPTLGATRGTVNNCFVPVTSLRINEVESSGGVPGDWVELVNTGAGMIDLSGWKFLDNDDTHTAYIVPAGTTIAPGGYLVLDESAFGFGLGAADNVRLFDPTGSLYESYSWSAHAITSYGRCPTGVGAFQPTSSVTKGVANDCSVSIRINEVESNGGTPGDWIELFNPGAAPANLAGFIVRDNDDTHISVIPAGVVVAPGGYYVVEEAALGFGLGAGDSARLFDPAGELADSYTWTAHASTTYGRCPNGSGAFAITFATSKGAANICEVPVTTLHINEVESNGGVPGDWFELINTGASAVSVAGWKMLDNDDTHVAYVFPAGTVVPAGGFLVVEEAGFGFGLGANDSVRLFDAGGTLYESYAWTTHAPVSYGRCPDGSGPFVANSASTKGGPNACGNPVKINEVESNLGVPGDWIELYNPAPTPTDISGLVLRDNDDTHTYTIPAGTVVPGGGYHVVEEAALGFGLGAADSVRLFDSAGVVLDAYSWLVHATTTYGRCPNGSGDFVSTTSPTKGGVNACPGDASPWPGDAAVSTVDAPNTFGGNLSGLAYEGTGSATPGILWGARNGPGSLFRLVWDGLVWKPDTADTWSAGKLLRYPDGAGSPDAEDVTYTDAGSGGGLYVATERDNDANGISRNSVLRFDVTGTEATLTATREWNLTADLPVTGPNVGLEAITWVPDSFLTGHQFLDESTGLAYDPAQYPGHGSGLFFVGVEAGGMIRAYALLDDGTYRRIATIASGFAGVMALHFDRQTNDLWVVCDDTCDGKTAVFGIDAVTHTFTMVKTYARPAGLPNLNNEGFTIAPLAECVSDRRPVFWADDSETGTHAIRRGSVSCLPVP